MKKRLKNLTTPQMKSEWGHVLQQGFKGAGGRVSTHNYFSVALSLLWKQTLIFITSGPLQMMASKHSIYILRFSFS